MKIIDLTENYIESYLHKNSLYEYEKSFPKLFDHYFTFWGDRKSFGKTLQEGEVKERIDLIKNNLPEIEIKFKNFGLDITHLHVVLFVGQGWTNGHSFKYDNEFYVFIPVEGYNTREQVISFVPHEILHAIHYQIQPEFYFVNKEDKERFSRMLITEGLATLLTKEIMRLSEEEALWADFLDGDDLDNWMAYCKNEENNLYKFAIEHFASSSRSEMFYTSDKNTIFKNRAGYYIGMKILEKIVETQKIKNSDLMLIPKKDIEIMVMEVVKEYK